MSNASTQVENKAVTPITPSANPAASAICHYRLEYELDNDIEEQSLVDLPTFQEYWMVVENDSFRRGVQLKTGDAAPLLSRLQTGEADNQG